MTDRTNLSERSGPKLFRPPAIDDYVQRAHLESILEDGQKYPIIVVCAPAGYGKSTQISHWVDKMDVPCAWMSLDVSHNALGAFLRDLEAGVNDRSPSAPEYLQKRLRSSEPPSANYVADAISSRMDEAGDEFILVLDDYQNITDADTHLFVESFLTHLPDSVRVAIVSRRTPPIALSRLRSRNLVLDLRLQDLMFDRVATHALVEVTTGVSCDDEMLDKLERLTEGWPTGLRMLLLASAGQKDMRKHLLQFEGRIWQIQEYLIEEVLRQLPPNAAKYVATTAILDRFSAELCESLIASITEDEALSGNQLVELIRDKGLFCVPLDERGEWFRYHHVFQELLLHQLHSQFDKAEIQQLHIRAAKWFDNGGDPEEAIHHYLESGNPELAAEVILRHKNSLIVNSRWRRLDRAMNMLPTEILENSIQLLALQSWTSMRLGRLTHMFEVAQQVEELIDGEGRSSSLNDATLGQISALRAPLRYHMGDGQAALAAAEAALELLPPSYIFERSEATMMRGVSLQFLGDAAAGRQVLFEALEHPDSDKVIFRSRVMTGLCYLSWPNGDLQQLLQFAKTLLDLGQSEHDEHLIVHACWFGGASLYQTNDLDAAAEFVDRITQSKWWPHHRSYVYCILIMAQIHAVRGKHEKARKLCELLINQSVEARSTYYLPEVHALQADLACKRGDHVAANQWAMEFDPGPVTAVYGFTVPVLTAAKILLHAQIDGAHEKAEAILDECQSFCETSNNTRFLIETLALQAIRYNNIGDKDTANHVLGRAVTLAEPGRFIRVFVDLGSSIVPILNRLDLKDQQLRYAGAILAAFQGDSDQHQSDEGLGDSGIDTAGLLEALSKRESEVLELLAKRLTNKEIGERLFIAPDTVKRHAHNIFEKLNVSDRRAARAKAIGLGLVSD